MLKSTWLQALDARSEFLMLFVFKLLSTTTADIRLDKCQNR
jgi:hypothetical protein